MRLTWPFMIRRVHGHSMLPVLPPGTVVYGWRWFMRLRPNAVIIFIREEREIIKRIDRVESDGLYVLGDHPDASTDSRHYGPIPHSTVMAFVTWPKVRKVAAQTRDEARRLSARPRRKDT